MAKKVTEKRVLSKFLDDNLPVEQIYARIPKQLAIQVKEICKNEKISIYKAVEIACKLLVEYYENKKDNR